MFVSCPLTTPLLQQQKKIEKIMSTEGSTLEILGNIQAMDRFNLRCYKQAEMLVLRTYYRQIICCLLLFISGIVTNNLIQFEAVVFMVI